MIDSEVESGKFKICKMILTHLEEGHVRRERPLREAPRSHVTLLDAILQLGIQRLEILPVLGDVGVKHPNCWRANGAFKDFFCFSK